MSLPRQVTLTPQEIESSARNKVPWWINLETPAAVPATTTVVVYYNIGPRSFVWTHYGFRSQEVGWPAAEQPFKIGITDISFSQLMQPHRFDIRAAIGTGDKQLVALSKPWTFAAMSNISVEFENLGAIAAIPYLVLHGYLE